MLKGRVAGALFVALLALPGVWILWGRGGESRENTLALEATVSDLPVLDQGSFEITGDVSLQHVVILGALWSGECRSETDVHCAVELLRNEGAPFHALNVDVIGEDKYYGLSSYPRVADLSCQIRLYRFDSQERFVMESLPELYESVHDSEPEWVLRFRCLPFGWREGEKDMDAEAGVG